MKEIDITLNRQMLKLASDAMRNVLDEIAIKFLWDNLEILQAIIVLRKSGKFKVSERDAQQLVFLGIMQIDEQGYFLSEAVEDLIDEILFLYSKSTTTRL